MVAYSFQVRFIVPICNGIKRQTIRKPRWGQARVGSTLQLYYAQRTVYCRLLGLALCKDIQAIILCPREDVIWLYRQVDSLHHAAELDEFARFDGFNDWTDHKQFWSEQHPEIDRFLGDLITWDATFAAPNTTIPTSV